MKRVDVSTTTTKKEKCRFWEQCHNNTKEHRERFAHPPAAQSSASSSSPKHSQTSHSSSPKSSTRHYPTATSTSPQVDQDTTFALLQEKQPCPSWEECKLCKSEEHKEKFFHPCRNGADCQQMGNQLHVNRFIHPCPYGQDCVFVQDGDVEHMIYRYHHTGAGKKPMCPYKSDASCSDCFIKEHVEKYLHFCSKDLKCEDKMSRGHTDRFLHSCHNGLRCKMIGQADHYLKFTHHFYSLSLPKGVEGVDLSKFSSVITPGSSKPKAKTSLPVCPFGKKCASISIADHTAEYRHPCPLKSCTKTQDKSHQTLNYMHPCSYQERCTKMNDKEHKTMFTHPCKNGSKCKKLNSFEHTLKYTHKVLVADVLSVSFPSTWTSPAPAAFNMSHHKLVALNSKSTEYKNAEKQFMATITSKLPSVTIVSIERNENHKLWAKYYMLNLKLKNKNGKENVKFLFHGGADTAIAEIAKHGFDLRVSNVSGWYGVGCYFAKNSSYSEGYAPADASGNKRMFLARVSLGDVEQLTAKTSIRKPNKKPGSNDYYDSVEAPTHVEFTVFHNNQAYPEYLITFK